MFAYIPPPKLKNITHIRLLLIAEFSAEIMVPSIIPNEKPAVACSNKIAVHSRKVVKEWSSMRNNPKETAETMSGYIRKVKVLAAHVDR